MKQLELFPRSHEEEIEELKEKYDRLRKSQHARITGLQGEINQIKSDYALLISHLCKGTLL